MRPLRRPFGALPSIRLDMQIIRGKNRPAYGSDVTINHADHGRDATPRPATGVTICYGWQARTAILSNCVDNTRGFFSSVLRCRRCISALLRMSLDRSPNISRVSKNPVCFASYKTLVSSVWNFKHNLMILIYILFWYFILFALLKIYVFILHV